METRDAAWLQLNLTLTAPAMNVLEALLSDDFSMLEPGSLVAISESPWVGNTLCPYDEHTSFRVTVLLIIKIVCDVKKI
jgi:hypothetical protein